MHVLIASTGAPSPAFCISAAASSGVLARPMTNSTLPSFFSTSVSRCSMASISPSQMPQLRSAGTGVPAKMATDADLGGHARFAGGAAASSAKAVAGHQRSPPSRGRRPEIPDDCSSHTWLALPSSCDAAAAPCGELDNGTRHTGNATILACGWGGCQRALR